jgi:hypothetical protein
MIRLCGERGGCGGIGGSGSEMGLVRWWDGIVEHGELRVLTKRRPGCFTTIVRVIYLL